MAIVVFFFVFTLRENNQQETHPKNGSFQYEDPRVPQVTYGKGREGNAFVSQCLARRVYSPEHAKISLRLHCSPGHTLKNAC